MKSHLLSLAGLVIKNIHIFAYGFMTRTYPRYIEFFIKNQSKASFRQSSDIYYWLIVIIKTYMDANQVNSAGLRSILLELQI